MYTVPVNLLNVLPPGYVVLVTLARKLADAARLKPGMAMLLLRELYLLSTTNWSESSS